LKDYLLNFVSSTEPKSYKEAINSNDSELWKEVMIEEINSLQSMETRELTDLPKDRKGIKSKWVFKIKCMKMGILINIKRD
jgi:hypothetical protein